MKIELSDSTWKELITAFFQSQVGEKLENFLLQERESQIVFPPEEDVFTAFNLTPFNKVHVVILGQDPYHGYGQAHGLSFSVKNAQKLPPSLKNIFKEQETDLQVKQAKNGNLEKWAEQGVLLLNAVLTVRSGEPNSHKNKGWEILTDSLISALSSQQENLVFLLWGKNAHDKEQLIDSNKHLILKAPHPSPLSAHTGFFGCKHFSSCNAYLSQNHKPCIDWLLGENNTPTLFD